MLAGCGERAASSGGAGSATTPSYGGETAGTNGVVGGQSSAGGQGGSAASGTTTSGSSSMSGSGGTGQDGGANAGGMTGGGVATFSTRTLAMDHVAEGADVGDIDGDGALDLVAGPRWYRGPDFELGGTVIEDPPTYTPNQYSTFFLTFVDDVDGDQRPDVLAIGDAGGGNGSGTPNAFWYRNPGPDQLDQPWTKAALYSGLVSNESPAYLNLLGDAKPELVFMTDGTAGFARPGASASAPWTYTPVTPDEFNTPYVHGLGVGDLDGDQLPDLVERTGWWRQGTGALWERHEFGFGMAPPNNWGGAQMQIFDVDGDGDNDVVTALAAHGYGLAWFEASDGGSSFERHEILPATAGPGNVSQLHALVAADVNRDGLTDLVAGKRYYAHPSSNPDPGTEDPAVLYWFELKRDASGARFEPHLVHEDSGAGCSFVVRDVTGDDKPDIFTTNKRGTFLHVQQ
jgi:hypothetical protein